MINRQDALKMATDSDERIALAKVLDMLDMAEQQHNSVYSDFLDPVKCGKFYEFVKRNSGLNIYISGGREDAERKMLGCCPGYMEIAPEDFPIAVLAVSYNSKYSRELTHRDFLGALMGLGIDRSRIGDIVINGDIAQIFVCKEISGYISTQLEKVGAAKVTVSEQEYSQQAVETGQELRMTVASLRLDAVLSATFHLSRGKTAALIEGEKAIVNWSVVSVPAKQLNDGDVVTLRGYGRIRIAGLGGKTKKDRQIVNVLKY